MSRMKGTNLAVENIGILYFKRDGFLYVLKKVFISVAFCEYKLSCFGARVKKASFGWGWGWGCLLPVCSPWIRQ